jgi:hypothetical protein
MAIHRDPILRWLLERGVDPNRQSEFTYAFPCRDRCTPLSTAAQAGDDGVQGLRTLLEFGAALDPMALLWAVNGGSRGGAPGTAALTLLIDAGADVDYVSERWSTALSHAVRNGMVEKVRVLLGAGADPRVRYDWHHQYARQPWKCGVDVCGMKACKENAVDVAKRARKEDGELLRMLEEAVARLEETERVMGIHGCCETDE